MSVVMQVDPNKADAHDAEEPAFAVCAPDEKGAMGSTVVGQADRHGGCSCPVLALALRRCSRPRLATHQSDTRPCWPAHAPRGGT